jgi:hypothetical protein
MFVSFPVTASFQLHPILILAQPIVETAKRYHPRALQQRLEIILSIYVVVS